MAKMFVVVLTSPNQEKASLRLSKAIKDGQLGDECHVLENVSMLRSTQALPMIYRMIGKVIEPGELLIVAPLEQKWLTNIKAKTTDECFEW